MTRTRRIASSAAALLMAFSMTAAVSGFTAFAEGEVSVKITDSVGENYKYTIYQILTGEQNEENKFINVGIGSDITDTALFAAVGANDLNGTITKLEKLSAEGSDADKAALAKSLAAAVKTNGGTQLESNITTDLDASGYYLVVSDQSNGVKTANILRIVDNAALEIIAKESVPTIEKKVGEEKAEKSEVYEEIEVNGVTYKYNDVADASVGEAVPFKLFGTLPSNLSDYKHYVYTITDTYDGGITVDPASIAVKIVRGDNEYTVYTAETAANAAAHGLTVNTAEAGRLTVSFKDIMAYGVKADDKITVEYLAALNTSAEAVTDDKTVNQKNGAKLTFSSNPNEEGWGDIEKPDKPGTPGEKDEPTPDNPGTPSEEKPETPETEDTPEDKVVVYTYGLKLLKTDGKVAVTGDTEARFTVFDKTLNKYVIPDSQNSDKAKYVDTVAEAGIQLDENGYITIIGLDDGEYTITEVTPPKGFKGLDAPVEIALSGGIITTQEWLGNDGAAIDLTKIAAAWAKNAEESNDITFDRPLDKLPRVNISNTPYGALPETGGIGTKLFYIGGGAAVLVSGVLLVTKRRMKKEEK